MKYQLYAAIVGASLWILTEILEMRAPVGHTPLSLWVTTIWHPILALGFWGLHQGQSPTRSPLSLIATSLVIVGLLVFAPLSVMFLYSKAVTLDTFMQQRPVFLVAGLLTVVGVVLFSLGIIRDRHYPTWTAYGILAALLLVVIKNAGKLPELVQHAGFIMLSLIIISMARFELRTLRPHA